MKNLTPKSLAALLSFVVTFVFGIGIASFMWLANFQSYLMYLALALIAIYTVSYFISLYLVEEFINSKINLIYKTIHRENTRRRNQKLNMSSPILEDVNREVVEWATENRKEISELKQQSEVRKELIGNLAHELKTPLFLIQGYLMTLLDGALYDENINKNYVKKGVKNTERLIDLVNDLDEISKIETASITLEKSKFNLVELCQEVINSLEIRAKKRNIKVSLKNNPEIPVLVFADIKRIHQVLTNLINNSINYGKDGGNTKIKFENIGENIMIEVTDNGLGIDKEHFPRLFERFYRVDKSRSRHQGGSGLGLAIVKHFIDAHNQQIGFRSEIGKGSTFWFTLEKG